MSAHAAPKALSAPAGHAHATPESERLPLSTKLLFGLPSIAGAAIAIPITVHMPKFYADDVLVPLGWIAVGIAIARALDAVTDPAMGWLSDRTRSRWGRRRPWIALGAPLCAIALVALFTPPQSLDPGQAAVWFCAAFIAYFLFHTVYDIPHYGLGAELTLDYNERTSLFGVRSIFILAGIVVGTVLPGVLGGTDIGGARNVFFVVSSLFGVLLVLSYALMVARIRERPEFSARESNPLVPGVRRAMRNRPFRILLLTYVIGSIPGAIPGTLMPFYTEYVLQVEHPDQWLTIFLAVYFLSGAFFLALWIPLARRIGKLRVWLINFGIGITGGISLLFMGPGDEALVLVVLAYTGAQFGAGFFLGPAMQADVIDYDELHTGKRREAQYGAFWAIATKLIVIPSAAIPLAFLGSIGYVPNRPQSPEVVWWIKAIFGLGPASFSSIAFLVARRYPISERIHRQTLEGIAAHQRGENTVDPLTGESLAPPRGRSVDERTGWLLDHFTRHELGRLCADGTAPVIASVVLKSGLLAAAVVTVSGLAGFRILAVGDELTDVDKMMITMLVVSGGMLLAGFLFQVLRVGPALRLRGVPVPSETVRAHLAELERF